MVEFLLIVFALVAYYVALRWFIDGCKSTNKDEGGKVFGGIVFLVVTGLVVCYCFGFMYPVIAMFGLLAFIFVVIGLDFLNQDPSELFGTSKMFGIIIWLVGLLAVYPTFALMLREGWYTASVCLSSGVMVVLGLSTFDGYKSEKSFSTSSLITFVCFLLASFLLANWYPIEHCIVVITDISILVIGLFFMFRKSKPLKFAT